MKKLVNLKGAKTLNREQQKVIFGGDPVPHGDGNGGAGGGGNCHYYLSMQGGGALCDPMGLAGCYYTCGGTTTFHGCVDSITECIGR